MGFASLLKRFSEEAALNQDLYFEVARSGLSSFEGILFSAVLL